MHFQSGKMTRATANKLAVRSDIFPHEARVGIVPEEAATARADLKCWPVYAPTPLVSLPGLAGQLDIRSLWVKDEGKRAPLNSFKAMGGAYALGEAIRDRLQHSYNRRPSYSGLWNGEFAKEISQFRAYAATDGNHGRSLAWGARSFGCGCSIFLPKNVSASREKIIAELGATIVRVDGNYEDAVAAAGHAATSHADRNGFFIQDTSDEHYQEPCRRIMHGYTLMSEEIREQWGEAQLPTHIFLHIGCGGMAAAVAADWWLSAGAKRPTMIGVEPLSADSFRLSVEKGEMVALDGDHETIMIGLSVGEVSLIAWPILSKTIDIAMATSDARAIEVLNICADGVDGDPPMTVGETGGAGIAALMDAAQDPELRKQLGLDANSVVLTINTEGAVDPEIYAALRRA
ncbi:MAG: diaminopropionate ammonia-lyase [Sphingorhabdus sp.]